MSFLPTAHNAAVRLVLGILVFAASGLLGRAAGAADDARSGELRPTTAPRLLPVEADEGPAPTTLRLLTDEPPVEARPGQSQLRLLPGNTNGKAKELAPSGPSTRGQGQTEPATAARLEGLAPSRPMACGNAQAESVATVKLERPLTSGHDGAWPSRRVNNALTSVAAPGNLSLNVACPSGKLPVVVGQGLSTPPSVVRLTGALADSAATDDAPPGGPWCFAGDSPPAGESLLADVPSAPTSAVVPAAHEEASSAGRLDAPALLAILEEKPSWVAQHSPEIPRVLPPPHALLPPDPAEEDLQGPKEPGPFRDETRSAPSQSTPRRLPASTHAGEWPGRTAPVVETPPQTAPPYDIDRELEQYSPAEPTQHAAPCVDSGGSLPCGGECGESGPRRLFHPSVLECRDVTIGGWVDQGITGAGNNPIDRYNGPVTFNDRYADYQMNQLYTFIERKTCTEGGGLDFGGRVDFLYGTDARFVKAADGLEASWGQTHKLYQAALPQFYIDAAWNDLTIRLGHFYTIVGYEQVPAPLNFFYSHSYAFQYGEPFTNTGMLAMYPLEEGLSLTGGFSRGIDQFDDTDGLDQLGALAGINWIGCEGRREAQFNIISGEQGPGNTTTIYSLVGKLQLSDRLRWNLEHNYGQSTGGNPRDIRKAEWYGLSQYLLYQWTEALGLGARIEWFCDVDGTRVRGLGEGNLATGPYPGSFYEITLGTNWQPGPNLILRPEIRWDWYNGASPPGHLPYDGGQSNRQLLYGFDVVVQF